MPAAIMHIHPESAPRTIRAEEMEADLVVAGGGLAGVCCAITAARAGLQVVLVQDRPVLGGNASSEVRLWALGATSHMGNNNRWAREGGVIDEMLVENLHRNPEGNPHLFDMVLLDCVAAEPRIRLLLNCAVFEAQTRENGQVDSLRAFCPQNETLYTLRARLFCDATGDGVVGFLAGAAFRMGAESRDEFGEGFAPDTDYGELLGHTIFFYSKDVGRPVRYIAPDFALKDITKIPRFGQIRADELGCQFWWLEFGGRYDTIRETERIKWELWKVVYGVWDHIKNSGKFPEAENLTLEWVGTVPGKRESRRFEGDYIMTQQDVIERRRHDDAVAFGGWAIDLHPADGVYSKLPGCTQWHSKGVYQIPYRSLYSRNVPNLFLAGRLISVSHVAFGSTRVMATTGHTGQAVGMAAALCREQNVLPRALLEPARLAELQRRLLLTGHHIPAPTPWHGAELGAPVSITASSEWALGTLPPGKHSTVLDCPRGQWLPLSAGPWPEFTVWLDSQVEGEVEFQLRKPNAPGCFTPEHILATTRVAVAVGQAQLCTLSFVGQADSAGYYLLAVMPCEGVSIVLSDLRVTGLVSVSHGVNRKVSKGASQLAPANLGIDSFEFWIPERRPGGRNLALTVEPSGHTFACADALQFPLRPEIRPGAWVACPDDPEPWLRLQWPEAVALTGLVLFFDTDYDHAMESVQWGHPEPEIPFCVRDFDVLLPGGELLAGVRHNYQTRVEVSFARTVATSELTIQFLATNGGAPAAVFGVQPVYGHRE
jgi:hypothetical protein